MAKMVEATDARAVELMDNFKRANTLHADEIKRLAKIVLETKNYDGAEAKKEHRLSEEQYKAIKSARAEAKKEGYVIKFNDNGRNCINEYRIYKVQG